jgi:hypothetical protein
MMFMFMLRLQCQHLRERGRNGLSRWRAQSLSRAGHPKSGHDLTLPSRRSRSSISCCIFSCRDSLCNKQGGRLWYVLRTVQHSTEYLRLPSK